MENEFYYSPKDHAYFLFFTQAQLTDQHRILRLNIVALAEALGGRLGDSTASRRLSDDPYVVGFDGPTPIGVLININSTISDIAAKINALEESLETQIDDLKASLQTSSTSSAAADGGGVTGQRTRQLQSDGTDEDANLGPAVGSALGLTVDVQCAPPRNGSSKSKSTKGMQSVTIDLYVNTQTFGKDCNATVSTATAMYVNKGGSYKSQVGRIDSSVHMAEGVQIVRIHLEKDKDEIYDNKDVALLHITAIKENGVHQKSVTFRYSDCHVG